MGVTGSASKDGSWFVTLNNGDVVCQLIESREGEAPAEPRVIIGTRQIERLRGRATLEWRNFGVDPRK